METITTGSAMSKLLRWSETFPLVDLIDWDFSYQEDNSGFPFLKKQWRDIYKHLTPNLKRTTKIKYSRKYFKKDSIKSKETYYLVDFSKFKCHNKQNFPVGSFDIFLAICTYLTGARCAGWMLILKNTSRGKIIAIDSNLAKLFFSIVMASWKFCIAREKEENAPEMKAMKKDINLIANNANEIISILKGMDKHLFDRALSRVVPIKDSRRDIYIESESDEEQIGKRIDYFRSIDYKSSFLISLSILVKMMNEIESDLKPLEGRRGNVLDRFVGGANLVLHSKAALLIDQYGLVKDTYDQDILLTCIAELLSAFGTGFKPMPMFNDDDKNKLKDLQNTTIKRVNKWKDELYSCSEKIESPEEPDIFYSRLQELLRGAGPAWRATQ